MATSLVLPHDRGDTPSKTLTIRDVDALGELHAEIQQAAALLTAVLVSQEVKDAHDDHEMRTVVREALTERAVVIESAVRRAIGILDQAPQEEPKAIEKGRA